jgi:hypothetical protein
MMRNEKLTKNDEKTRIFKELRFLTKLILFTCFNSKNVSEEF